MPVPPPLVEAYRRDLAALLGLAEQDVAGLFRQTRDAEAMRDLLLDVLPQLVDLYGSAAATLAADWYEEVRDAAGVGGAFRAVVAEAPDVTRVEALARWGVGPMFGGTGAESAQTLVFGGLQKIVADMGRETVTGSLRRDPSARGWERHTRAGSCDFCRMLEGRGAVYSAATADFAAHDTCHCVAVPVLGEDRRPVRAYTPSQRRTTPVPAAVVRQYV